jgi:[ribosomal protein S5]-alanine N-acetyltransferase
VVQIIEGSKEDMNKHVESLNLKTARLDLRAYRQEDWKQVHIYGADPDFSKYEIWGPNTLEDTHKFVSDMILQAQTKPRYKFDFALNLKENGLMIGGCGIRREAELSDVANLGWAITPLYQGQGYATEAAKSLIQFGFQDLKLSLIYATCDTRNIASLKVMEKLGMKQVGIIKGHLEIKGHMRDSYRYEIRSELYGN